MLVVVLTFAGACTRTKTLDAQGPQGLDEMLSSKMEQHGIHGVTVTCPDDVKVAAGGTFDCSATAADGTAITIQVNQADDQGNVTFKVSGAG
jgi:hypothetical protein